MSSRTTTYHDECSHRSTLERRDHHMHRMPDKQDEQDTHATRVQLWLYTLLSMARDTKDSYTPDKQERSQTK